MDENLKKIVIIAQDFPRIFLHGRELCALYTYEAHLGVPIMQSTPQFRNSCSRKRLRTYAIRFCDDVVARFIERK